MGHGAGPAVSNHNGAVRRLTREQPGPTQERRPIATRFQDGRKDMSEETGSLLIGKKGSTVKEPPQRSGLPSSPSCCGFAAFHCVGFRRYPTSVWCAHSPFPGALIPKRGRRPRGLTAGDWPGAASGPFAGRATGAGRRTPEPPIAASPFPRRCLRNVRRSRPPHW